MSPSFLSTNNLAEGTSPIFFAETDVSLGLLLRTNVNESDQDAIQGRPPRPPRPSLPGRPERPTQIPIGQGGRRSRRRRSRGGRSAVLSQSYRSMGGDYTSLAQIQSGEVIFHPGANLVETRPIPREPVITDEATNLDGIQESSRPKAVGRAKQRGGGIRKPITEFSQKAQRASLLFLAAILIVELLVAHSITLTLPSDDPSTAREAKAFLNRFLRVLMERWPNAAGIWRLEATKLGVPHFHVIVLGVSRIPRGWLKDAWWEACRQISDYHRKAGTRVQPLNGFRGATYLLKRRGDKLTDPHPGRLWGVFGPIDLYKASPISVQLAPEEFAAYKRILHNHDLAQAKTRRYEWQREKAESSARRRLTNLTSNTWHVGNADQLARPLTHEVPSIQRVAKWKSELVTEGNHSYRDRIPVIEVRQIQHFGTFAAWDKSMQQLVSHTAQSTPAQMTKTPLRAKCNTNQYTGRQDSLTPSLRQAS